jgi:hypothetical protein
VSWSQGGGRSPCLPEDERTRLRSTISRYARPRVLPAERQCIARAGTIANGISPICLIEAAYVLPRS